MSPCVVLIVINKLSLMGKIKRMALQKQNLLLSLDKKGSRFIFKKKIIRKSWSLIISDLEIKETNCNETRGKRGALEGVLQTREAPD